MRRRQLLRGAAVVLPLGMTGCIGDSAAESSDGGAATSNGTSQPTTAALTRTETPTETATPAETPTPTDGPTATETATATSTPGETATDTSTPVGTATSTASDPEVDQKVVADNSDWPEFRPETFEIAAGDTVQWVLDDGFNIVPVETPAASDWEGTPGDEKDVYDEGDTHTYTFEVAGDYKYTAGPYRGMDLYGTFTVTE